MPSADEYARRLDIRRADHSRLADLDRRLSHARLAVFGVALVLAVGAFGAGIVSAWWLLAPALLFVMLAVWHDRAIADRDAAARAVSFYERGLARIGDRWAGTGEPGSRFEDDDHLYANDLDLFGRGSLFELLSIARTRAGEETLAAWLTAPAAPPVVRSRQEAVRDMAPRLDLREALALAGADVGAGVDTGALLGWADAPARLDRRWARGVAAVLTGGAVAGALDWVVNGRPLLFMVVVAVEVIVSLAWRRTIQKVLHAADRPARDLDILAHVLARLEGERFASGRLGELRASLDREGVAASVAIRRLHRLAELHDWQHNQFFAPIAAVLLWGTHLAHAIEAWRRRHGVEVAGWLATVGEFEAFSSLSAYRYEHPDDAFPEIIDAGGAGALYAADALGHPLLPASRMVRNDVHFTGGTRLLVVSGSNMSGKSTLLRTVGINAVLALAGAPVRASRLRLTPVAVGATLRIQDSLQEGRSRFYAEITRLRRLADLAVGGLPLLFLLDELFHGTNSHDRLVGATGVLRSLLDRGAIGLITTHDLALTQIAAELGGRALNAHFEDVFEDGEIRFDYRLKPGAVTRSNAIALMRAVGLAVEPPDP